MPASTLEKNRLLNFNFGNTAYGTDDGGNLTPNPGQLWFGLALALVTATTTGTTVVEPTVGSYARVNYDNNKTTWSVSSANSLYNAIAIDFVKSTAAQGIALSLFIANAVTAGDILWYQTLSPSIVIQNSTVVSFEPNTIIITM